MKNIAFWTLLALNAVLLVALGGRLVKGNPAMAQLGNGQAANGRDDFLMIPGEINGGKQRHRLRDRRDGPISSSSMSLRRLDEAADDLQWPRGTCCGDFDNNRPARVPTRAARGGR